MKRQPLTLTPPLGSIRGYKHRDPLNDRTNFPPCDAFPNRAPEAVRKNRLHHRRTISDENGIRFGLAADTGSLEQVLSPFEDLFMNRGFHIETAK